MNFAFYISFPGTCEEALSAYADLFGGEVVNLMRYQGSPAEQYAPEGDVTKVMHASLKIGDTLVMGSDAGKDHHQAPAGMNISVQLNDTDEADRIFAGLSDGGNVTMPMEATFWARKFGKVTDRWGVHWMINCE